MQTGGKPSFTSYDYQAVTCIPVIASFDSEGHIAPLYIRINGISMKVDSYWIRSTSFQNILDFNCKVIDGEYIRPITIYYHQRECVWTVKKD